MGSDSDLNIMQSAADVLKTFGISFELTIVSAHRTPQRMFDYAASAKERGLKVIIAGAGGATHLPGINHFITHLPVIFFLLLISAIGGFNYYNTYKHLFYIFLPLFTST